MNRRNIKKQNGFTIIEVLIVLAIAGLIILIVFLAVPALQRNSRNTQRKNDVSAALGAVSEYASNNNGKLPDGVDKVVDIVELGFYDEGSEVELKALSGTESLTDNSKMVIYTNARCDTSVDDHSATDVNASSRNVVVLYRAEVGSGGDFQTVCQES